MSFYYKEPKAGNLWVFALDGGGPAKVPTGTNLTTLQGGLPRVGEPGHTLGGRVLPGYGFPATEGSTPIQGDRIPQPTSTTMSGPPADPEVLARGERLYRARCVGCHQSGGASGPNLFRTGVPRERFEADVTNGVSNTLMPSFGSLLSKEEILAIYAFVLSRDRLE
jgi:mono/diheme cytochrome c family protein